MEKIIKIDGNKDIKFVSNGATPIRYKRLTGNDFFEDIFKLNEITRAMSGKGKRKSDIKLDTDVFYNICWVLRKGADKDIPPLEEWLEEFDSFPVMEIIGELNDLLISSIQSKK